MALVLALASPLALAQGEAAVTRRATELREAPASSGRSLAALPAQSPLTRLGERQGPWVQVRTEAGATGWLHLFDVGPATSAAGNMASGALRGITSLFAKGGPSSAVTVPTSTIGVRGLGAEDLARAQPDPAAVGHMESLRQNENQARAFARAAALRPVAVDALPAPSGPGPALRSSDPSNPQSP
jgi:hypothetical protein